MWRYMSMKCSCEASYYLSGQLFHLVCKKGAEWLSRTTLLSDSCLDIRVFALCF